MASPVSAGAVRKLLHEIAVSDQREHVLAVGGAGELAPVLRQQLLRGRAEPGAVQLGDPENADVYVHVMSGEFRAEDEAVLRRARRARVPVVVVAVGFVEETSIPYVLATDVVWADPGHALPLDSIARAIAARLGERGAPLAARVPLLRGAVTERLVASFSRRNGIVAAAVWIPGADLPVLALNQFRLTLRLAQIHGAAGEVRERLPELAATLAAGLAMRAVARKALRLVPGAGWAVKAGVAYAGTRAVGQAARMRFAVAPRPQRGGAEHVAP
jgi:uncharacterized protein (DUF697 family)